MGFILHRPCNALLGQIDAFWELKGGPGEPPVDALLPDGCTDLILNAGDDLHVPSEQTTLKHGRVYLGGAFTHAVVAHIPHTTRLIGIRFKPGCLSRFHDHESLHLYKDACEEVPARFMPDLKAVLTDPVFSLHTFLLKRMQPAAHDLSGIIAHILQANGNEEISSLARRHYITERQLERNFGRYVGLSPKQFCNVVRFSYARRLLQVAPPSTLLDLALEAGYYDHAHFTREFKKYTGSSPSLPNVGFVQTRG